MTDLDVQLNRISPVPLYHQLALQLEAAVASGQLAKGSFLDNELDLAERWQVSRPTVRRAIQDLVDSGLLVRRRGVGTQIVNAQVRRPFRLSSLHDDLAEQGRQPTTTVITHERTPAPARIAESLALPVGAEIVHLVRCRFAGTRPLAVMRNWLTMTAAGHIETEQFTSTGLYSLIREHGVRPHSAAQTVGAAAATAVDAEILGLAVGAPLVTMRRVMQDDTGAPVEVGEHVYDAAQYTVELHVIANS